MSRTKALENVKLTSFDDLFGGNKIEKTAEAGDVKEIPLSELHEFHNHPFQICSDEELAEMIESVREHGVLVPGIVRKRKEGGYEIIAGHTRKHVCEILGFETMPVFVKRWMMTKPVWLWWILIFREKTFDRVKRQRHIRSNMMP